MQTLQELEESIKKIQKESEDKINSLLKEYKEDKVNNVYDTIAERVEKDKMYYFINLAEDDLIYCHAERNDYVDVRYHKDGNYFHTEEEAKKYAKHFLLSLKILRLRDKLNNECEQQWGEYRYCTALNISNKVSELDNKFYIEQLQFKTEEIRENFRKLITDEEIIKFLSF